MQSVKLEKHTKYTSYKNSESIISLTVNKLDYYTKIIISQCHENNVLVKVFSKRHKMLFVYMY